MIKKISYSNVGLYVRCSCNDNNSLLTDNNIQPSSPIDSPQSKKIRRSSSHHTTESENDDENQEDQYEHENGITNGKTNKKNESFNNSRLFSLRSFTNSIRTI